MSEHLEVPGILLFYEDNLVPDAGTIFEHLDAFSRYSQLPVYPVNLALGFPPALSSLEFSVTVFHYSLKPTGWWLGPELTHYLTTRHRTYKVAIFQDEIYYFAERLDFLNRFRIDCLYTRHKPQHWDEIYPTARTLKKRVYYLAGYVSEAVVESAQTLDQPLKCRPIDVAYRGRRLPYYFGLASQEKARIADKFVEHAQGHGMHLDISVNENQRFYGKAWHEFLARAKGVLGVEGGVSVIDTEGVFLKEYAQIIKVRPELTFEQYAQLMGDRFTNLEDRIYYRSLTPRHFESAAFRNVQILYEGRYDDVMTPGVHYISLRKDFSNIADVLSQLRNVEHLQGMVDQTWRDLVGSRKYSYESFIRSFDIELEKAGVRIRSADPEMDARLRNYLEDWKIFSERFYRANEAINKPQGQHPKLQAYLSCAQMYMEQYRKARPVCPAENYTPRAREAARSHDHRFWENLSRTARLDLGAQFYGLDIDSMGLSIFQTADQPESSVSGIHSSDRLAILSPELCRHFDGVVMLTWSNWRTEPRSNRYHFATRFARYLPVLFVQPDGTSTTCVFEETEVPGITLVHVPPLSQSKISPRRQSDLLAMALTTRGIRRPLVWIYNPYFDEFVRRCHTPLKVYHATEDYFTCDRSAPVRDKVVQMVEQCDLIVAVSNGVADSYRQNTKFDGPLHVAPNGCDYDSFVEARREAGMPPPNTRVAIFQGGINWRVDFELLLELTALLPDWEFQFCGQQYFNSNAEPLSLEGWQKLQARPNVRYLGYLNATETASAMCRATIGMIPFVRDTTIMERSLPLKAFEYVACGLPVVSIPIRELAFHPDLFTFADSAAEFANCMVRLRETRWQESALQLRDRQASQRSFESSFTETASCLLDILASRPACRDRLNVLILFDQDALKRPEVNQQLDAFHLYSRHSILFFTLTENRPIRFDLALFDAVIVHGSLFEQRPMGGDDTLHEQLKATAGFKAFLPMPGQDLESRGEDWCKALGLHYNQEIHGTPVGSFDDADRRLMAASDNWLESMLPPRRRARLHTVLAGFESPESEHSFKIIAMSNGNLDHVPGNAPGISAKYWISSSQKWKDWMPNFLRRPARAIRDFLYRKQ